MPNDKVVFSSQLIFFLASAAYCVYKLFAGMADWGDFLSFFTAVLFAAYNVYRLHYIKKHGQWPYRDEDGWVFPKKDQK